MVNWENVWGNMGGCSKGGNGVRSRLVAQELASNDGRDDLFAGTPPLAAARYLLSDLASKGSHVLANGA